MAEDFITTLESVIRSRQGADPTTSYTAKLFAAGRAKIAQKVGEEAVETVIASLGNDKTALVGEATDLMFHLLVLLADAGLSLDDIRAEMRRREGVSGIDEKAARLPTPVRPE
ncbi:MAG: phosphoribosyl-ATP diphosphatase [Sphingomonas sp. 28-62-20]|uniref:phosphoribosyl-ATP diphosphatase n=1 Tax=Sphingomonas sp. 28-62-20 TaxID=1970433 RepID=UPI000BD4E7C6|nr:MAG: phosphoribosyl-ATP diphosphatase [Sphingomonas sp. 28-62-20]